MTDCQDYQQARREALERADKARRAFYKKFAEFETSLLLSAEPVLLAGVMHNICRLRLEEI